MELWQMAIVVLVIIGALAVGWWLMTQRRRTEHLAEQYGPEYERMVDAVGDRRAAERELQAREDRVRELKITALSPQERDSYASEWSATQAEFVDDPAGAVAHADLLVQRLMRARGYPTADFDQREADLSVDYPQVVAEYRAGHEIAERHARDGVETEDLRQAMVHYRALFDDLLQVDADTKERELTAGGVR